MAHPLENLAEPQTATTQSAGSGSAASIDLKTIITKVDAWVDLSAVNDDVVFEVSKDATNWREHTRIAQEDLSTGGEFHQFDTAYQHCRIYYNGGTDGDVTLLELSAKGVA